MVVPPLRQAGGQATLGASYDGSLTTFRLRSEVADRVELCLIEVDGPNRGGAGEQRHEMRRSAGDHATWELSLATGPGQRYGYRVHGPWDPAVGLRCNPAKLLLDPYALRIDDVADPTAGSMEVLRDSAQAGAPDERDSLHVAPWSVVTRRPPQAPDTRPRIDPAARVIYEAHLGHLTRLLPDVDAAVRGTWTALRSPTLIAHLRELGVTTLELLPVTHFGSEPAVLSRGMRNVWGYNPLGFLAAHPAYCVSDPEQHWDEIAETVQILHEHGLEVVLDVVYNHTAEGGIDGPAMGLRGIDNHAYYRHDAADAGLLADDTGCGNTVRADHPAPRELILDALRHWVRSTGVDGFRFDLATTLGRDPRSFTPDATLLQRISADPLLHDRLLIAEPWDLGPEGYQLGSFTPPGRSPWLEWNDVFRDSVRDFWRPHHATGRRPDLARALAGSSDAFGRNGHGTTSSVSFVTAHDGFTLHDLTAFDHKHNHSNGEHNRDGSDHNRSWNSGSEGPTVDEAVQRTRFARQAGMLTTLLLSVGTPMLLGGDELGRTQHGNNNPYCLDGDWLAHDWAHAASRPALTRLVSELTAVRRRHRVLYAGSFLSTDRGAAPWAQWFGADGVALDLDSWPQPHPVLVALLGAEDRQLVLAVNGSPEVTTVRLPTAPDGQRWLVGVPALLRHDLHSHPTVDGSLTLRGFGSAVLEPDEQAADG